MYNDSNSRNEGNWRLKATEEQLPLPYRLDTPTIRAIASAQARPRPPPCVVEVGPAPSAVHGVETGLERPVDFVPTIVTYYYVSAIESVREIFTEACKCYFKGQYTFKTDQSRSDSSIKILIRNISSLTSQKIFSTFFSKSILYIKPFATLFSSSFRSGSE